MTYTSRLAGALAIAAAAIGLARAQAPQNPSLGYSDTPMLPGGKWHVHDGARPQPTIVTPGTFSTEQTPGAPPSDAIVLFNGTDLSKWQTEKGDPAAWTIESRTMVVAAGKEANPTKDELGDFQLDEQWTAPKSTFVRMAPLAPAEDMRL